ncbi:MAG: ADP-heptose--LPS heptosyltransferase [Legionellales bacterium RIFCSPHIGHO2_12_FULL_35_11]|nr:MAG: ADP-heptose--LPS heptosyltransferase [Legionellales bacterium RIFCSPHIGHO2_12_FULL_35_11]
MNNSINSICIVRLSALGDVLMMVPLIRTLQKYLPEAKLTWIISNPAYELVKSIDGVEFIVIDKPNNIKDYLEFNRQMRNRKFDVLLAVQSSFRANLLYGFIRAKRKIGYDKIRAKDGHKWFVNEKITSGRDHTLDGFLRFAKSCGVEKTEIHWDLKISAEDLQFAKNILPDKGERPLILINSAASKPERSWTVEGYVAIIKYAVEKFSANVVLIGGPNSHDLQLSEAITNKISVLSLVGKTKLTQLLAIISLGDLLICPDTGPSHMGVAVGTPVLALHAVTSSNVSGPYTFRDLSVDCYDKAVEVILNKTIETNVWGTHAHGMSTMQLVTIEMVIDKLKQFLTLDFMTFSKSTQT